VIEFSFLQLGGGVTQIGWFFQNVRCGGEDDILEPVKVGVLGYI
jgi:hypothetical protein